MIDDGTLTQDDAPVATSTSPQYVDGPPAQRSAPTTWAAIACFVIGVIAFAWGMTWMLIGLDRDATPVFGGGIAVMVLGALSVVGGWLLWIRREWAAEAVTITYGVNIVATLFFALLSAVASGANLVPYVVGVVLIIVFALPVALLRTEAAKADFPGRHRTASMIALWSIVAIWTLPSAGLLLASFRREVAVKTEGWWTIFTNPQVTLDNYRAVLESGGGDSPNMGEHFLNSLAIVLPATVIPISIALFAAYAFAWMEFPGRKVLFVLVVSMMAVPLQMSLIPLLQLYTGGAHIGSFTIFPDLDLNGSAVAVWLTHTGFGLPLAIFLLYNYVSGLPSDLFEAARIDGADHYTIFWRLVLPLSVPAIAAFGIFQFLWTWNDYLIALTFIGSNADAHPLTIRLANLSGGRGQDWHVLTAAAFVSMAVPLIVFFSLQRYFVRGLLAGSVKG